MNFQAVLSAGRNNSASLRLNRDRKISLTEFRRTRQNLTNVGVDQPVALTPSLRLPLPFHSARNKEPRRQRLAFPESVLVPLYTKINIYFHSKHHDGYIAISSGQQFSNSVACLFTFERETARSFLLIDIDIRWGYF